MYKQSEAFTGTVVKRRKGIGVRTFTGMFFLFFFIVSQTIQGDDTKNLSSEQWREDLHFMVGKIEEVHPDPFFGTDDSIFFEEVDALHENIPHLTQNEIRVGLLRIPALLGD